MYGKSFFPLKRKQEKLVPGSSDALSELKLRGGEEGVRLVLYAGKPTGDAIVSHGPFIGGSNEDIIWLYTEYRQGKMKHIATVDEEQKLVF